MIKKLALVLLGSWLAFMPTAKADEGMWLPMFIKRLNYTDMQKAGLKLTPEEIYSVNNSSLKDAILGLGSPGRNFCTGEIISKEGLFLTNHHCGYGTIQENSTIEHNYLKDGFWAMKRTEEIPAGFSVSILDHMEDVTSLVMEVMTDEMSESERAKAAKPIIDSLKKANSNDDKNLSAVVKSFFHGNEYYMFVYKVYSDIRLVGAPPSSIGKYGGDTDNWMWPRHTGDFCMFRIYTGKDNEPAKYSEDNTPFKPKHHLPVNIKGTQEGDYAMIMGFPGSTDRFLSSYGVKMATDLEQPARVDIRRAKLDMYEIGMNADEATRIKYASKHAQVSNYWKYFIGQTKGLKRLKVYEKKKAQEDELMAWVAKDESRKAKYGEITNLWESGYKDLSAVKMANVYIGEALFGTEILPFSFGFSSLLPILKAEEPDAKKLDASIQRLKGASDEFFKDYDAIIDQNVLSQMMRMYYENLDKALLPENFVALADKNKQDFDKMAATIFKKSIFTNAESVASFLDKPSAKSIEKDPAYQLFNMFYSDYMARHKGAMTEPNEKIARATRLFVAALREMNADKSYAPDANSTLRLTYGNVLPYDGKDAVSYKYYTTAEGILEKYVPGDLEFDLPENLIKLIEDKDYGRYGKDRELRVCFLSNNDITGGNSGSPVINAEGHLIGTAFDGNWEAMSGDIAFETELQRTISVDIRYTLFIVDKFAGAGHLVDEMTVIE